MSDETTPTERMIAEHGTPATMQEAAALLRHALRPGAERWELTGAADLMLHVCEREETIATRAREELARVEAHIRDDHSEATAHRHDAELALLNRIIEEGS
jgi:hypothetical protein